MYLPHPDFSKAHDIFYHSRVKSNYKNDIVNISIPYYPALSKPLRQISDRHNISLTFTSNRNLRKMLTKTKTQPPPHTIRNVIYQMPCKDCNATYCGQTRRPLHLRLSEHQRFTNNSKSFTSTDLQYTSAVAHHTHTTGHTIDFKTTHILSSLTKSSQLNSLNTLSLKSFVPHSINFTHKKCSQKRRLNHHLTAKSKHVWIERKNAYSEWWHRYRSKKSRIWTWYIEAVTKRCNLI